MSGTVDVEILIGSTARATRILIGGHPIGDVRSVHVVASVNEPTRVQLVLVPKEVKITGSVDEVSTSRPILDLSENKSLGQVAFEAWLEFQDYRPENLPKWSNLRAGEQAHWENAALAVAR